MAVEKIEDIIDTIKIPLDDPQFYARVFTLVARQSKSAMSGENSSTYCGEEYDNLSRRLDRTRIQESCSVRNVLRTRRLANMLINDKGEILLDRIPETIKALKACLYSFGPNRQYDSRRQEQILNALQFLQNSKEAQRLLKNISKPISHRHAEDIIRSTLQLSAKEAITDAHARRAALSAWMCYLRQNVGSCFATAPAIIVHDEQSLQFLKDINEILSTGRLKRTFGGIEYAVPLSASWGAGDLKKNMLFQSSQGLAEYELWISPGLIAAFEAAGVIPPEIHLKQKAEQAKSLIQDALDGFDGQQPFFITNAEDIIRRVLLKHLNLTEQDIQDYEHRPQGMMQGSLMMQSPMPSSRGGGKGEACANFGILLESAENAFKALADNALLKAWEFSIASFAETKAGFTRWNLYSSLGFRPEDKGGIGPAMYEIITHKIEQSNLKIKDLQDEYEMMFSQLKYLEARLQRAQTEKELEWLKIDYKTKRYEFDTIEELRDNEHQKGQRIANMYDMLIDAYYDLFPKYFQEVYDADMHEVAVGPYDDSPAGFRLLYKHGRANTSQWTYIHNPNDFIQALGSFFTATEIELSSRQEFTGLERELSEIITSTVQHTKTDEFLETAFYRMAAAHNSRIVKKPLEHLDKIEKKPWAYTSGGTMGTLVSCYFGLEDKPSEISRWVENPMELLVYFVDTIKQIPHKLMEDYASNPKKSMLIHSPTHAFLLKPGMSPFKEAWLSESFTYTWVRDQLVKTMERAIDNILLEEGAQEFLIGQLAAQVPENYRHYFRQVFSRLHGDMSSVQFRNYIVDSMQKEVGLQYQGMPMLQPDDIDSLFYSLLPVFPIYQMRERVEHILEAMPGIPKDKRSALLEIFDKLPAVAGGENYSTARSLQEVVKALLCLASNKTSTAIDVHATVAEAARQCGYALGRPIVFADSNWVKDDFGFVVSPGTGKLELWRVDPTGTVGAPMSMWVQWLNGSRKDLPWGIYTRPYEYLR